MTEDERQAATLKVGISSYVGTATLALIAGVVAIYTYVRQYFEAPWAFSVVALVAVLLLVSSFVLGGKGADKTAERVGQGTWNHQTKTPEFEGQAILTLIGLIALIAAAMIGTLSPSKPASDPQLPAVAALKTEVDQARGDVGTLRATVQDLTERLHALESHGRR